MKGTRSHRKAAESPMAWGAVVTVAALLAAGAAFAAGKTYTTTGDFNQGTLINTNATAVADQLQLNTQGGGFPVLWVANAGEDTVSKFDTANNKEVARYRTWFGPAGQAGYVNHLGNAYGGAAPSRTCVDTDGNVYVANRHFDGRVIDVVKILNSGGIDRNGNGVIDTSSDLNSNGVISGSEILPMADANGNGIIDPNEIQDERIAWVARIPGTAGGLGRSLCIGTDGNLWVGSYYGQAYWKMSSTNGNILAGPVNTPGLTPYGCLVDGSGMLWSASLSNVLGQLNTNTNSWVATRTHVGSDYGIALGNGHVYQANSSGYTYTDFIPGPNTFSTPAYTKGVSIASLGIATDGAGNIVVGNWNSGGVAKFDSTGTLLWSKANQGGAGEVRGVAVDSNNDIWLIHRTSNNLSKFRGTDGASLGVYPVGDQPYTYSDATGFAALNITQRSGDWTVVFDGATLGLNWGTINWNASVPAGASIKVEARAADTEAGLGSQTLQQVSSGVAFNMAGRFIEIKATLSLSDPQHGTPPVLYDLTVASAQQANPCDINQDGKVDRNDVNLIFAQRGKSGTQYPALDIDKDGLITVNDARACVLKCTNANCAP